MKVGTIFFLIGVILIVLKWQKFIVINNWWVALCFLLWILSVYMSVHNKNKERNISRPVHLTKQ